MGVLGTGLGRVSFFKGRAREGLAEKLTAERRPGGSKDRTVLLFKERSSGADILCKGPEVRVTHVCAQNIRACVPGAGLARGRGAGDAWDAERPLGLGGHFVVGERGAVPCGWMATVKGRASGERTASWEGRLPPSWKGPGWHYSGARVAPGGLWATSGSLA